MKKEIIVLDVDKAWARQRIAELEQQIQGLGPEFYEVFNQSSETWHDNAPFDALRDRQSVLDAELQHLKGILRNSAVTTPKKRKNIVGIGSTVIMKDRRYFIAGDWTPDAGQIRDEATVLSCNAPLAQQLIGKRLGDVVTIAAKTMNIESIV